MERAGRKNCGGRREVADPAWENRFRYAGACAGRHWAAQKPPAEDPIKPASQWTVRGKTRSQVDAREFVTGGHRYSTDLRPEGMLYGRFCGRRRRRTLISYDDSAAKGEGCRAGARWGFVARRLRLLPLRKPHWLARVQWKEAPQISQESFRSEEKRGTFKGARFRQAKGSVEEGLAAAVH